VIDWMMSFEFSKPVALVLFFSLFLGIVFYVFTGRERSRRLESYKNIPFLDEDDAPASPSQNAASKRDS